MYYTMVKYLTGRFPPLLTLLFFFYHIPIENLRNTCSQLYKRWFAACIPPPSKIISPDYPVITSSISFFFERITRDARVTFLSGDKNSYYERSFNKSARIKPVILQTGRRWSLGIINGINGRNAGLGVYKQTRTNLLSDARCANLVRTGSPKSG